jgi:sugar-specific transcriptional regulator TrmB
MTYKIPIELPNSLLSENESTLYCSLLEHGGGKASIIARQSGLSRVITYQILESLIEKGLVQKKQSKTNSIIEFYALHPRELARIADRSAAQAEHVQQSVTEILGQLSTLYAKSHNNPTVQYIEGVEGLTQLYEDILNEKDSLLLFRSPFDDESPEIIPLIMSQIEKQREQGIHTRALTPLYYQQNRMQIDQIIERDIHNLVERRTFPQASFQLPSQIVVYRNKVAITSFGKSLATTTIESKEVSLTLRTLFELLWLYAKPL